MVCRGGPAPLLKAIVRSSEWHGQSAASQPQQPQSRCWPGLGSHEKAQLGKDLLLSFPGFSKDSLSVLLTRGPSFPAMWVFPTWENTRENQLP
jgi:hypothetical protein